MTDWGGRRAGGLRELRNHVLRRVPALMAAAVVGAAASGASPPWNLPLKTLGGKQYWTDLLIDRGWRIQRSALDGHCRLLDAADVRRAWGSYAQCAAALETARRNSKLGPWRGERVVVVLHGLGRSRASMQGLCDDLARQTGWAVANMSYASTRGELEQHARALGRVVGHLDGFDRVDFVAHSLGNLVVRRYLAEGRAPGRARPSWGRFVMLAPPNQGAQLAQRLGGNPIFDAVLGPSGRMLARHWRESLAQLGAPPIPFGVIAGAVGPGGAGNPVLDGPDDGVVRVAETRLPGASDFLVLPVLHTTLMNDKRVRAATRTFLAHGYFLSEAARRPIPREASGDRGGGQR